MKTSLYRLALVIFGIVAALLVLEVIIRATYSKPWHEKLVEEQAFKSRTARIRRNKLGLRDRNYTSEKSARTTRVLVLGDSFTFGSGVSDDRVIFPELLEAQLNLEFAAAGKSIEILNGGIPGSTPRTWVDLLSSVRDLFKPDVVLIVYFLRDGTRLTSMRGFFGPIRQGIVVQNRRSFFYQNSYLYRRYKDSRDRLTISQKYTHALNSAYFGSAGQTREWAKAQSNLLKIKAMAQQDTAKVGLVIFPMLVELNDQYPFKKICETIEQFGKAEGFPALNLLPAFLHKDASELWVSPYNQHPNAAGHKIAADAILPFLRQIITESQDMRKVSSSHHD